MKIFVNLSRWIYTLSLLGIIIWLICFTATFGHAQNVYFDKLSTQESHVTPSDVVAPVTNGTTKMNVPNAGVSTYCWFVVSHDAAGNASQPTLIGCVSNAPTLSVNYFANLSWQAGKGNTTYDVLRSGSPQIPSGTGNYLVISGLTQTVYSDSKAIPTSYTVQTYGSDFVTTNEPDGTGHANMVIRYGGNAVYTLSDSATAGATPNLIAGVTPWFDIRYYGAKCDGVTDDTSAIQSAINAAQSINTLGGGTVYVPDTGKACIVAGDLNITKKMRLVGNHWKQYTAGSNIVFTGNGGGACSSGTNGYIQLLSGGTTIEGIIFQVTGSQATAGTCVINVSGTGGTEISGVAIDRIVINGGSASSTNYGIWIDAADTVVISNNIIANTLSMVFHPSPHGLEGIHIHDNTFTQCTSASEYMIDLVSTGEQDTQEIVSNIFEGSNTCNNGITVSGLNASGGVVIRSNWMGDVGTAVGTWIKCAGCIVESNKIIASAAAGSYAIQISGSSASQGSRITGNTIQGAPIYLVGDAQLLDNHFSYTASYNVKMQNTNLWAHGNQFITGSYNSYYCYSGTCNLWYYDISTADLSSGVNANVNIMDSVAWKNTAPTIASGFGTSPSIPNGKGAQAFTVNVGTGGTASSGVVTLPAAQTGWACNVTDSTHPTNWTVVQPTSATSVTFTNYNSSGTLTAWTASDVLVVDCRPYK